MLGEMDSGEFRKCADQILKMIVDYMESGRERPVLPDVQPGYLRHLLPDSAPEESEPWQNVLKDIERVVMPGMTHWNSPQFHAYFPTANSYAGMLGDLMASSLTCIGFSWIASPACTELEMVMMDWLGKALQLPEQFLFESKGKGGGIIQTTASEATLVALLAARSRTLEKTGAKLEKLVAYTSSQSHSSVERAALLGAVRIRLLPTDEMLSLRGETLRKAIQEDREKGDIPFYVVATLGTTNTCAFDNLKEIGNVCESENIWLHVDAAYAGSSFICPEFRPLLDGVELADSFNFNPHKWLLVNFDCSAMWVKNQFELTKAFEVNPAYLKYSSQGQMPDYRHWQIPLGRRFRSLKLWFVMRIYGLEGLRQYIRTHVSLAKEFEKLVCSDDRFEVVGPVILGLVCFRLKGPNSANERLLQVLQERRRIFLVPTTVEGRFILRFAVCSRFTESRDVAFAWDEIRRALDTSDKWRKQTDQYSEVRLYLGNSCLYKKHPDANGKS